MAQKLVERLAKALREERPEFALTDEFRDLAPRRLDDGPTLHIDDLSKRLQRPSQKVYNNNPILDAATPAT